MTRSKTLMVFAAGLLVGLAVAFLWPFGHAVPSAAAQGGKADSPRFQISTWAHAGTGKPGSPNAAEWQPPNAGAYSIDTQNGTVWQIITDGKLNRLGKAE